MTPEIADSQRDDLTGLPDAHSAYAMLARWQADYAARGHVAPIHAMLLGLGRFDTVNLAYGEATGDVLVKRSAWRLHFAEDDLVRNDAGRADWWWLSLIAALSPVQFRTLAMAG
ncbi:MAG: hypothetical protein R3E18_13215 [Sphingomonadaceae bacterium]